MLDLTKENFEAEVLKAEGKVFVDFYGDGCVPCAALMPYVHEYSEKYGDPPGRPHPEGASRSPWPCGTPPTPWASRNKRPHG